MRFGLLGETVQAALSMALRKVLAQPYAEQPRQ